MENDSPGAALDESQVVQEAKGLLERTDGNNVDLDQQVSNLKRNAMLFQTFSNLLAAKMDTMKRAMNGCPAGPFMAMRTLTGVAC
ncbi:MAG: hypothetical protein R3C03_15700 [Pirellulaceae bacterium]